MNSKQRYNLIRSCVAILIEAGHDGEFAIFENADNVDEYLQVAWTKGGSLKAEVSSREWTDPVSPLAPTARENLHELGFEGGGPERNYSRGTLPSNVARAAHVLQQAFDAAYGSRGADLVVKTNSVELEKWLDENGLWTSDPTHLPAAQPLRLDMLRWALESHDWRVFTDEKSGGFMTFWSWSAESGQGMKAYFEIDGNAPFRVLAITVTGDLPVRGSERPAILEFLNTWNDERRWPAASLWRPDGEDYSWIHLRWSLPAGAGVAPGMVADVSGAVVAGSMDFFRALQEQRSKPAPVTAVTAPETVLF